MCKLLSNPCTTCSTNYTSTMLFCTGFQPVSLLPPSLTDYTTRSQTLPIRGKHSKRPSNSMEALHSAAQSAGGDENKPFSPTKLAIADRRPPNTRYIPQVLMNHISPGGGGVLPPPPSPVPAATQRHSATDGSKTTQERGSRSPESQAEVNNHSPAVTPIRTSAEQSAIKHAGKTPGEIVMSALKSRKPSSGLKKAMNMYQENRKQTITSRKMSEDGRSSLYESDASNADRLPVNRPDVVNRSASACE